VPRFLRSLAAQPLLAAVAVVTLTLGLGVNAAIFSLTREVLLRPLPYRDGDRLVRVFETNVTLGQTSVGLSPVNFAAWRDRVDAFESFDVFRRVSFNVSSSDAPAVQVEGFLVGANFFPTLGIAPAIGRGFTADEVRPGRNSVVLVTDGFWRRRFDASASIVGRSIDVDGTPCTIVGVLPSSFRIFRVLNRELELFRPMVLDPTDREHSISVYARLKPGVTIDAARTQLRTAYATLPIPEPLWTGDVMTLSKSFAANARPILLMLEWAAALVLLIACANIANLLLAASLARRRELAIRLALGASRWRIARDLAGETMAVTVPGGVLAVVFAFWIVDVLNATVSFQDVNRLQPFRVDVWVIAFVALLTAALTLLFGLLPTRAAADTNVVDWLKDASHGATSGVSSRRFRHGLIVGELALSIVLTATALALARSALTLHRLPRGLAVDRVMTGQVTLADPRYADVRRLVGAARIMVSRLAGATGVESATLVNYPPLALIRVGVPMSIDGQPPPSPDRPWVARYWVTAPDYFRTAGIPIVAGRDFNDADDATKAGVAIVSASFARRFWPDGSAIGRRVTPIFPESNAFWIPRGRREPLTIVGIAGDVREDGLADSSGFPQLYMSYAQHPTIVITLMARTRGVATESVAGAIRDAVRAADPQAAVSYESSLDQVIAATFARPRENAWVVGAFGVLALALSAVGVYGLMAFLAAARTREIGIRVALGAAPIDVVALIVGHAMKLTAFGVAAGIVLAPMAARLVGGILFGASPIDPLNLFAVAALLGLVALAAAAIPAVRSARAASLTFR
jgi:putative ABC transport system permease protein